MIFEIKKKNLLLFFFRFQEFAPPPLTFKKMLRAYFLLIKERLKLDTQQ